MGAMFFNLNFQTFDHKIQCVSKPPWFVNMFHDFMFIISVCDLNDFVNILNLKNLSNFCLP